MVDLSRIFEKHFTKNFTPLHEKYTPRKRFECFLECIAIVIDAIDRVEKRPTKGKNLYMRVLHIVVVLLYAIVLQERRYNASRHETEPNSQANRKYTP